MDKYVVELIGTFFLVLTIGLSAELGPMAPLAIGAVLMAMIYAGGHISCAHFNPAVTIAFWLRGRCAPIDVAPYLGAQFFGAALAAAAVGSLGRAVPAEIHLILGRAMLAEVIFTFALVWVILNVATARGTAGNGFYGSAIASVVVAGAYTVGPISGAVFNPAVALALCLMGTVVWSSLWLYVVASLIGALLATLAFKALVKD